MNNPTDPHAILDAKLERADRLEAEAREIRQEVKMEMLGRILIRLANSLEYYVEHSTDSDNMEANTLIDQARALVFSE